MIKNYYVDIYNIVSHIDTIYVHIYVYETWQPFDWMDTVIHELSCSSVFVSFLIQH